MNLMLSVIFSCVLLGLVARRFGAREQIAVVILATGMTLLYLFFSARFM